LSSPIDKRHVQNVQGRHFLKNKRPCGTPSNRKGLVFVLESSLN
jgi:hypothetical protein